MDYKPAFPEAHDDLGIWDLRKPTPPPSPPIATPADGGEPTKTIDNLMIYIQALKPEVGGSKSDRSKSYRCPYPQCEAGFTQRTHLDIHIRSHTGEKPFKCDFPGCKKWFSQRGNLHTHMRSHTGEKPFMCSECGRRFGQRGNLKNHSMIHSKTSPIVCKLDGCNKRFNQLGNLKSHQNNTHKDLVDRFTRRLQGGNHPDLTNDEQEMFDYFRKLYKNSNRGIKGRGKGTRAIKEEDTAGAVAEVDSTASIPTLPAQEAPSRKRVRPVDIVPRPLPNAPFAAPNCGPPRSLYFHPRWKNARRN